MILTSRSKESDIDSWHMWSIDHEIGLRLDKALLEEVIPSDRGSWKLRSFVCSGDLRSTGPEKHRRTSGTCTFQIHKGFDIRKSRVIYERLCSKKAIFLGIIEIEDQVGRQGMFTVLLDQSEGNGDTHSVVRCSVTTSDRVIMCGN